MNWTINTLLLILLPFIIIRIIQRIKCLRHNDVRDSCSWLDICYAYDEHPILLERLQSIPSAIKEDE